MHAHTHTRRRCHTFVAYCSLFFCHDCQARLSSQRFVFGLNWRTKTTTGPTCVFHCPPQVHLTWFQEPRFLHLPRPSSFSPSLTSLQAPPISRTVLALPSALVIQARPAQPNQFITPAPSLYWQQVAQESAAWRQVGRGVAGRGLEGRSRVGVCERPRGVPPRCGISRCPTSRIKRGERAPAASPRPAPPRPAPLRVISTRPSARLSPA